MHVMSLPPLIITRYCGCDFNNSNSYPKPIYNITINVVLPLIL